MATPSTTVLAQQIEALRRRLNAQRTPQLAYSAVDNGAITVTQDGQQTAYVGVQYDGTSGAVVVAGPKPPKPSIPTLVQAIGGVKVSWDGTFVDPQPGFTTPVVAPLDFAGVDVQVSNDVNFPAGGLNGLNHGSIVSAAGGEVFVSWDTPGEELYARLVTRTKPGKFSDPSLTVGPVSSGQVQLGDLGFNISDYAGGTTIYFTVSPATPTAPSGGFATGDLWLEQTGTATGQAGGAPSGTPLYQTSRWLGSEWALLQDQGVSSSLASAIAAQQAATSAGDAASAAQSTADSKITAFYQATAPTTGMQADDLWVDSTNKLHRYDGSTWLAIQDADIPTALGNAAEAQTTATGKVTIFTQAGAPSWSGPAASALWLDSDNGNQLATWSGTAWTAQTLGNGSITPNSLIASNVIATGTVTAALMEAVMVLATTIMAGPATAAHATLESDGIHLFAETSDGVVEVGRLGTGGNDYFAFTDTNGIIVGSWDSTGYISASGGNFTGDITVQGRSISDWLDAIPGGGTFSGGDSGSQNWYGWNYACGIGNVTSEVGLFEMPVEVTAGRAYLLMPDLTYSLTSMGGQLDLRIRDGGTGTPSLTSSLIYYRQFGDTDSAGYDVQASDPALWMPTTSGQHRLLLSVAAGGAGAVNIKANVDPLPSPTMFVLDLGPAHDTANTIVNRGGGSSAPAQQQYDTGWLSPTSRATFQGNGTGRSDTTDIVQGWDPSGYNGDGYGFVGFNLPTITGTINSIQLSLPWNFTYFNSGGTALLAPLHSGSASPVSSFDALKMEGTWPVSLAGKTGSMIITLPAPWWPHFLSSSNPRATFIGFGPSGGTDETYYVRFTGPNIQLRILYTQ